MKRTIIFLLALVITSDLMAQKDPGNYDESKIPEYILPDPLVFNNGAKVTTERDWIKRRKEIYKMFSSEVYGFIPEWHGVMEIIQISRKENVFDIPGTREEVIIRLKKKNKQLDLLLLLYLPESTMPVAVFAGYNFYGNQTITDEPDITFTKGWIRNNDMCKITGHKATEASRGFYASQWPVKVILARGYGLATLNYGDVDPDENDGFNRGVHLLYPGKRDSTSWGKISSWAWGLSRVMDYLETNPRINAQRIFVVGHSRLGKTALWAGASDKRFALVISNNSGRVGAALTKRIFGEPLEFMHSAIPYWFCDNFGKYTNKESLLPVDQHELITLIAPRFVYVASAEEDLWADPKGEFLSCMAASPVFKLLKEEGFTAQEMPVVNYPVTGSIGYHIRTGKHDVTLYDWQCFMDFADYHFKIPKR